MGPWLTEKIDETIGLTLKIKNTSHPEAIPYPSVRYCNQWLHRSASSPRHFFEEWNR
jgi:hypothetical protein